MGLDMYLRSRRYFSGWERVNNPEEMNQWEAMLKLYDMREFATDDSPHGYVEFCVAYWRKAHDIHSWFVQHVQGGVDECQAAPVTREQLEELRLECLRQLADTPEEEGRAYGDDETDWLRYQLRRTVAQIDKALKLGREWTFVYQSSW